MLQSFIFSLFVFCSEMFENVDVWAVCGPLVATVVLVAKNCVDRSFSELLEIQQSFNLFGGAAGSQDIVISFYGLIVVFLYV